MTASTGKLTLTDFLLARIVEDYERECGGASVGAGREVAARLKGNLRRHSIGFAVSMRRGYPVPYANDEAEKYADHPDYRDEWRP